MNDSEPLTYNGIPIKFVDDIPGGDIFLTNRLQVDADTHIEPRGDLFALYTRAFTLEHKCDDQPGGG